jgi:hypothetical protein
MVEEIKTIEVQVKTGPEDPAKDVRIFLGFKINNFSVGGHVRSREFRLRQGADANPFRSNTTKDLIFGGSGANVENKSLNDPTNPQLLLDNIIGAYIRISPESKESWKILGGPGNTFVKVTTVTNTHTFTLGGDITLQEDSGEEVDLGVIP